VNQKKNVDIIFLKHLLSHIGVYSGYENFIKKLDKEKLTYKEVIRKRSLQRYDLYRRLYITNLNKKKVKKIGPFYNVFSYLAEMEALKTTINNKAKIIHNTFLEDNHGFLGEDKTKYRFSLIATTHMPMGWWKYTNKNIDCLKKLSLLLALTNREKEFFERFIPGKVRVVRHGVDTDFFNTTKQIGDKPFRLLLVGNMLRDFHFFEAVVSEILNADKEILVDLVCPFQNEVQYPIFRLCKYSRVAIHRNISNQQLLDLYNNSRLLFLPLIDSTVNNSILEASASGVPVITTDLPGIKEYTNNSFAFYYKDQKECVDYIMETIKDDELLKKQSCQARNFMLTNFSLERVAKEHSNIYREFL
jgi:glycosyltransferase involved in cell wall biosynthesis